MSLSQLDLNNWGRFEENRTAAFTIESADLPAAWEYIYQNRRILMRVDQHGPVYAQADPPTDIMLFRREPFQRDSSWLVWLRSDAFHAKGFTNYFRPLLDVADAALQPERVRITYAPAAAVYLIEHEGVRCETELLIPPASRAICMKVSVTNLRDKSLRLSVIPVLRPYVNPAMLAPWDKPEWYLKTGFCNEPRTGFWTQLMNMNSEPEKRRAMVLWSEGEWLSAAEISYEKLVGQGNLENPEAVLRGSLRLKPEAGRPWGVYDESNSIYGYPPVHALQYDWGLHPGETRALRQVLALLPNGPDNSLPTEESARSVAVFLDDAPCRAARAETDAAFEKLIHTRRVETPDPLLDHYVNEWLPLQQDWVCSLDRGWPSGMRGSRDSANDFTAMVPLNPAWSREIIETMVACQRSDGWFPRQYSALGRRGKHDMRGHVDAGNWFIELLYEHLCFTKDLDLLDQRLPWLDSDAEDTILDHALRAQDYFIRDERLGEHGLCKIGEGDWLDSVNRAGLRGRGESVTVSNQTVIALTQMSALLERLRAMNHPLSDRFAALLKEYAGKRAALRDNLRAHAFNAEGYFNSVFNDDGHWLFSDNDPDGRRRVYGPACWFSISSGVAVPDLVDSVLKELDTLKCEQGYRLLYPAMGDIPIERVGRGGSGDLPEGLWENANAYNQGSHGFLGRALGVAGRGDLLYEVIRYLLPYDQVKHPVTATLTPPYAVVNCWQRVPLFPHRGGLTFLTGSIAYGLRMVYDWMFGIRPMLDGLAIDPCVPSKFRELRAAFPYLGKRVELHISNPNGAQTGVREMTVNGRRIERTATDPFSLRTMFVADDDLFAEPENAIHARL